MKSPDSLSLATPGRALDGFGRVGATGSNPVSLRTSADRSEAARGPLPKFGFVRLGLRSAHRGRRCPRGAHAVAVGAVRRLHCDARARVVPQNSLRSLRSLRSNSRGKSVHEARWRAPTLALRFSSPQKSPPAGSACREVHRWFCSPRVPPSVQQRHARAGEGAPLRCREGEPGHKQSSGLLGPCERPGRPARRGLQGQGSWPRAQRASSSDSSTLSERSDRRSRSEFGDGAARPMQCARTQNSPLRTVLCLAHDQALAGAWSAGESAQRADRRGEAPQPARACLCRATQDPHSRHRKMAKGRKQLADTRGSLPHWPYEVRWSH